MQAPGRIVSFDFETELIRPGVLAPPPVCLALAWREDGKVRSKLVHAQLDDCQGWLGRGLREGWRFIGHNAPFDVAVAMEEWWGLAPLWFDAYANGRVLDTGIRQKLIDNAHGRLGGYFDAADRFHKYTYSLAALEKRLLGLDRSAQKQGPDVWRFRYGELMDVPIEDWPAEARQYALDDAVGTLLLFEAQEKEKRCLVDQARQSRAFLSLHLMGAWGVKTDPERIRSFEKYTDARYKEISRELSKVHASVQITKTRTRNKVKEKYTVTESQPLIRKDGSRNTKVAKAIMLDVCKNSGIPVKLTKTGYQKVHEREVPYSVFLELAKDYQEYVALDEDACEATHDDRLLKYAERISLHTNINSRIPALWKGVDTPIQAQFNAMVSSGRTSCLMGKPKRGETPITNGFQLQNPPRKGPVRECFVARDGYWFADADFSGLELCTMAQVCIKLVGFSKLGDAINRGIDPHLWMAANMRGTTYDQALGNKRDPVVKEARQLAKIANFGFPGGLGPGGMRGFARGYGVHLDETKSRWLKNIWLESWPEFKLYFQYIRDLMNNGTCSVVQLYSGRHRGLCKYTEACNGLFQGLGADGAKNAAWAVTRACYDKSQDSVLFGARPWNFVHDQILTEVKKATAHEQAVEMSRLMTQACNEFLPDVPTSCEPALSKHWCKDIESVYGSDGRLVPWDIARDEKWKVFYKDGEPVKW